MAWVRSLPRVLLLAIILIPLLSLGTYEGSDAGLIPYEFDLSVASLFFETHEPDWGPVVFAFVIGAFAAIIVAGIFHSQLNDFFKKGKHVKRKSRRKSRRRTPRG